MSKINKLIIIHGLNNNLEAFAPLKVALENQGFSCHQIILPGHQEQREETKDTARALEIFDARMKQAIDGPYGIIAFSQGALYLQLWLEKTTVMKPSTQILLAPALYIRNFTFLNFLMRPLPNFFIILSQMPALLRRYPYLHVWEYRNLFNKAQTFAGKKRAFEIPTHILIDEKDELVDAQKIKQIYPDEVELIQRPYLQGRRPGKYHVLFHPDFFSPDGWDQFIQRLKVVFNEEV